MSDMDADSLAGTFVLNALGAITGNGPVVLTNEVSAEIVRSAYENATEANDRAIFERELQRASHAVDAADLETMTNVVQAVLTDLVSRGIRATITHKAPMSLPTHEAILYSFMTTHDPCLIEQLALSTDVAEFVRTGALALTSNEYEEATVQFEQAVTASAGSNGAVATRVLGAYTHHLLGNDSLALDYVEEALHLDTGTWTAKAVGLAANHRFPEKFRSGKLGVRVFFRWRGEMPDDGNVSASISPAEEFDWTSLIGSNICMPIEQLWPESVLRLRLSGRLPDLPVVHGYYVGFGVVDQEVYETRSVEQVFLTGPKSEEVVEAIEFTST